MRHAGTPGAGDLPPLRQPAHQPGSAVLLELRAEIFGIETPAADTGSSIREKIVLPGKTPSGLRPPPPFSKNTKMGEERQSFLPQNPLLDFGGGGRRPEGVGPGRDSIHRPVLTIFGNPTPKMEAEEAMYHRRTNPEIFSRSGDLRHDLTEPEARLWQVLRGHRLNNIHFRRQHAIGSYIVDFCAPHQKLIIEVDGELHLDQQEYDHERSAFLISKGYRVLRFWNNDVINNLDGVIRIILDALEEKGGG